MRLQPESDTVKNLQKNSCDVFTLSQKNAATIGMRILLFRESNLGSTRFDTSDEPIQATTGDSSVRVTTQRTSCMRTFTLLLHVASVTEEPKR